MGGASSTPAASSAGGYSSSGAMARATIGGTTGSNVAGVGWVPKATAAGSSGINWSAMGNALSGASKQFGNALANQQYGVGSPAGGMFTPDASSFFAQQQMANPFLMPTPGMPQVRSTPFRMASVRPSTTGYSI